MSPSVSNVQDNQLIKFAVVMFGSVVTAVALSTVIIMSLLGGPSASALTTQNNNTQSGVGVGVCVDPSGAVSESAPETDAVDSDGTNLLMTPQAKGGYMRPLLGGSISGSFNTTNSNSTVTTTTYNTTTWTIRDNGNTNSASWNNGNTATYAPVTNTTTNTSQNNGNQDNDNNGNTYSAEASIF